MSVEVLLAFRFNLGLSATVAAAVARSLCFEGLGRRFTQLAQAAPHAFPVLEFLANGCYAVCSLKENSISITRAERGLVGERKALLLITNTSVSSVSIINASIDRLIICVVSMRW